MDSFTTLRGVAAPLLIAGINTDQLAPTLLAGRTPEEMPLIPLREKLFAAMRYDEHGQDRPGFVLNQPRYRGSRILLTGPNFGCGSSRETAVWALMEYGIRCVIAPSFADIFQDNAFQNGMLPLTLSAADITRIAEALERSNDGELTIDLSRCVVEAAGIAPIAFAIQPDQRTALLEGLNQLNLIMRDAAGIEDFEQRDAQERPWIYGCGTLSA